ncbi:unnamed protein product, partial [Lymnaea stagnalis]
KKVVEDEAPPPPETETETEAETGGETEAETEGETEPETDGEAEPKKKPEPVTGQGPEPSPTRYVPPYTKKLPPLKTYEKPKPPVKYTGAPPPGTSKPYTSPLYKTKPWVPPPSPPTLPKKPPVPRLSGVAEPRPAVPQRPLNWELPYSQKYKIGESGKPGREFVLHHLSPLPPIADYQPPTHRSVPVELPTKAEIDAQGNISIHIDGDCKAVPKGAHVQVTLVRGYVPMEHSAGRNARPDPPLSFPSFPSTAKMVPLPSECAHQLDPFFSHDQPGPGRFPRLNTTMTMENYIRYRRLYP